MISLYQATQEAQLATLTNAITCCVFGVIWDKYVFVAEIDSQLVVENEFSAMRK